MAPLVSGGGRSPRYEPRRVERGTETQQAPPWGDEALVVTMDVLDSREHGGGTRGPVQMMEVLRSPDEVAAVLADVRALSGDDDARVAEEVLQYHADRGSRRGCPTRAEGVGATPSGACRDERRQRR